MSSNIVLVRQVFPEVLSKGASGSGIPPSLESLNVCKELTNVTRKWKRCWYVNYQNYGAWIHLCLTTFGDIMSLLCNHKGTIISLSGRIIDGF